MMMMMKITFGALTLVTKTPGVHMNVQALFAQFGETLTPWMSLKICPSLIVQMT